MPRKSLWARLPFGVRMTASGIGILAVMAGAGAGTAALVGKGSWHEGTAVAEPARVQWRAEPRTGSGVAKAADSGARPDHEDEIREKVQAAAAERDVPRDEADRTSPRRTAPKIVPAEEGAEDEAGEEPEQPRVERVEERQTIPYRTMLVRDPSLPRGESHVRVSGLPGERTLRYEVTYVGSVEKDRRLLDSSVTREPRHRVIALGNWHGGDHGGDLDVQLGRRAVEEECTDEDVLRTRLSELPDDEVNALDLTQLCEGTDEGENEEPEPAPSGQNPADEEL
jgi:hypothetical protein